MRIGDELIRKELDAMNGVKRCEDCEACGAKIVADTESELRRKMKEHMATHEQGDEPMAERTTDAAIPEAVYAARQVQKAAEMVLTQAKAGVKAAKAALQEATEKLTAAIDEAHQPMLQFDLKTGEVEG